MSVGTYVESHQGSLAKMSPLKYGNVFVRVVAVVRIIRWPFHFPSYLVKCEYVWKKPMIHWFTGISTSAAKNRSFGKNDYFTSKQRPSIWNFSNSIFSAMVKWKTSKHLPVQSNVKDTRWTLMTFLLCLYF